MDHGQQLRWRQTGPSPHHGVYFTSRMRVIPWVQARRETRSGCPNAAPDPDWRIPCFSSLETDIDFHHNMFVNISHRIPETDNKSVRWVNNLTFNWAFYAFAGLGGEALDIIGNKWVRGNLNASAQAHEIHVTEKSPEVLGNPSVFVSGNVGPNQSDPNGDQYLMVSHISGENGRENGPIPDSWKRTDSVAADRFSDRCGSRGEPGRDPSAYCRQFAASKLRWDLGQPPR